MTMVQKVYRELRNSVTRNEARLAAPRLVALSKERDGLDLLDRLRDEAMTPAQP